MGYDCESKIRGAFIQGRGAQVFQYYWEWLEAQRSKCFCEAGETFSERRWQEFLYQHRWGSRWISEDGELIEVLDFGRWNHHAEGPDFVGAIVRFGKQFPIKGDLELDRDVRDWERHNHAQNAAYGNVLVHFFFEKSSKSEAFTRNLDGRQIRQVLLDPHQIQTSSRLILQTKRSIFSDVGLSDVIKLIEAAAHFRMLRKRENFRKQVIRFGLPEALFQAMATGLGYRSNSLPLSLLTRRVGLESATSVPGEALLFGVAGFLRGEEFMQASEPARKYLRRLWDFWWYYRNQFLHKQLPPRLWSKTSVRPLNYPERRIGALVLIARQLPRLQELLQSRNDSTFVEFMKSLHHPFWQCHSSFSAKSHEKCLLLGEERALDLLVNVFYPAQDLEDPAVWNRFQSIRLPVIPQKILESVAVFIGENRLPKSRLREVIIQQGILQMISHFDRFDIA